MTTNLTLPQDNAVIDYSIISQLVNAINQQQADIDSLKGAAGPGGSTTTISKTVGGQFPVAATTTTSQTFVVPIPSGMTSILSGVAVALSGASKPVYTWVSGLNKTTSVTFSTSAAVTRIYYILYGTV